MERTKVIYLDAADRTRTITFTSIEGEPDGNWYMDHNVLGFRRRTSQGFMTTLIPLNRVLRVETFEALSIVQRRTSEYIREAIEAGRMP